jgi:hypothetical protein
MAGAACNKDFHGQLVVLKRQIYRFPLVRNDGQGLAEFADGGEGAVQLIQPKASFIEQTSGPGKPRFFVLSLNYDPADRTTDIGQQIAKRLDTRLIKKMLKN